MERRASEPDQLEDLFRIDHLTTRMRRNAEGLVILAGESPGRGWRHPVPLVDVLRAAVAEVEDYTRIRVISRTEAALAGSAVADVIHLVAELAENATIFSPPNTPVRILGDTVGRGFAIEIEDRGLGISPEQLAVINRDLADPPEFDLSGSDRLGLFVAARLAQRHDIKISLRPSVYGGTTAIVVIPLALVARPEAAGIGRGSAARELPSRLARRPTALGPGSAPGPALSFTAPDNAAALTGAAVTVAVPAPEGAAGDDPRAAEPDPKMTTAGLIELGLPVRVRQESLAPRLREQAGPAGQGNGAAEPAGGAARAAADRSRAPLWPLCSAAGSWAGRLPCCRRQRRRTARGRAT